MIIIYNQKNSSKAAWRIFGAIREMTSIAWKLTDKFPQEKISIKYLKDNSKSNYKHIIICFSILFFICFQFRRWIEQVMSMISAIGKTYPPEILLPWSRKHFYFKVHINFFFQIQMLHQHFLDIILFLSVQGPVFII